jgi:hypothetical protein
MTSILVFKACIIGCTLILNYIFFYNKKLLLIIDGSGDLPQDISLIRTGRRMLPHRMSSLPTMYCRSFRRI